MNRLMIALAAPAALLLLASAAQAQAPGRAVVLAGDIPVAHTPPGFWKTFPAPVLARCTEPLAPGAPDLRGVWTGDNGGKTHIERIQQCGDRVVIEGDGVTHDMRADGVLAHGVDDIAFGTARPIKVAAVFENNGLSLKPFGGPTRVTRVLKGDVLVFTYIDKVMLLHRIAALPPGT
jgi:hypothetical protein